MKNLENTGKNRRRIMIIKKRTDGFFNKANKIAFAHMAEALKNKEFSSIEEEILELKDLHDYIVSVEEKIEDPSLREIFKRLKDDREVILDSLNVYVQDMIKLGEM